MQNIKEVNKTNIKKLMEEAAVLIDFRADWCPPCRIMDPLLEKLSENKKYDKVTFSSVDVDNEPEIASLFQVQGIPNFVFISRNKVVGHLVGMQSKEDMEKELSKLLGE